MIQFPPVVSISQLDQKNADTPDTHGDIEIHTPIDIETFKSGENPRPWLVLNNDSHPFGDEEYVTVTLTTTPHDEGVPLDDADWIEGGMPRQSYASPWVVASPKHAAIVRRQGRLTESFVRTVVDALGHYLEPPTEK